jgi:putative salt-induced outer membrane protein YdiY
LAYKIHEKTHLRRICSGSFGRVRSRSGHQSNRRNLNQQTGLGKQRLGGSYGENDSVKNNETLHGVSQYNHLFGKRFYGFFNLEGLHDGIADLQYRFTLSPGAGYYFIQETNTTLAGEVGPGLIFQRLGGVDTTYASLRLAERFEHKFHDNARVWQKVEFLPQVNKPDNFLVNAEIGAEAALTKTFSLQAVLQDNFVNQPAPGRKDNDVKLISSLVYKF